MPDGLERFQETRDLHFITCSCYRRKPFFGEARDRDTFCRLLERTRAEYDFTVVGYVVMPEHFHMLVSEPQRSTLATAIQVLKQSVARDLLQTKKGKHFWLTRYYDFNVFTRAKEVEKLKYIHRNPVKRGLVEKPDDWIWSSYRNYSLGEDHIVQVNAVMKRFRAAAL